MSEVSENPVGEAQTKEPARTIDFWKKKFTGIDKRIFEMIVFEQGLEDRDRLTKSQVNFYMDKRKRKKIS